MASAKLPWMKFYTGDFLADESLRSCSMAAKGMFPYVLSMMHRSVRRGYLLQDNGQPRTMDQVARLTGCSTEEAAHLIQELITSGVFSTTRDGTGTIFSRWMLKQADISEKRSVAGGRGARAKHLPQQNSGKGGGKTTGNALKSDSTFVHELSPEEEKKETDFYPGVGVQGEGILLQQNSRKIGETDEDAWNAAADRCTVAWLDALVARRDPVEMCMKTFRAMMEDDGIPEDHILAEIALGPKTVPKRRRSEFLNEFHKRVAGQNGFTSNVAGVSQRSVTAVGPAPAEATSLEAAALPAAMEESAFAAFKREMVNRTPSMPSDHSFIDPWEKVFARMTPPATGEEMLYGLESWLMDERRASDRYFGIPKNAMVHIRRAINKNRQIAEREACRIADIIARTVPKTPKARPTDIGARAPAEALETAPPPWVAYGECSNFAQAICEALGAPRFSLWFAGKTTMRWVDHALHIGTPNKFLQDWISTKFAAEITAALAAVGDGKSRFMVVIDPTIVLGAVDDADADGGDGDATAGKRPGDPPHRGYQQSKVG